MAAEWTMRGYRVNKAKLWNLKPSPKLKTERSLATLVDEVLTRKLDKAHARGYRSLLAHVADATQKRIGTLTTRAPRKTVAKVLAKLGAKFTAKSWDKPTCPWPWLGGAPKVLWPSASLMSPAEVVYRERELREAGAKDKNLDARLVPLVGGDADAAAEMGDVIRTLHGLYKAASPAALVILLDGEQ
ncbi:MAG TPA: hypothetical protein VL326_27920 [Kofleriaceae bacterium]|nr:hypothetical protein [Kofleriaceae bacterium]